jgi:hypothetical protein
MRNKKNKKNILFLHVQIKQMYFREKSFIFRFFYLHSIKITTKSFFRNVFVFLYGLGVPLTLIQRL